MRGEKPKYNQMRAIECREGDWRKFIILCFMILNGLNMVTKSTYHLLTRKREEKYYNFSFSFLDLWVTFFRDSVFVLPGILKESIME